jgi:hypothetical protein
MSRATGGGGGGVPSGYYGDTGGQPDEATLERQRDEIMSGGSYRSLEELDRERERKRQELYLEEKQRERGAGQQQQQSTSGVASGYKSLGDLDREVERKRQELYLEEKQREMRPQGKGAMIEILDEKDLPSTSAMPAPAGGVRSLLPSWAASSAKPASTIAKPTSEADQRLQHAAREMSEALVLKAGELKDSAFHMTSSLGKRYSTYLPARFTKAGGAAGGATEWERYGRKMDRANRLLVKAERRASEARNAPPSKAAELHLKANKSRQKALQKAISAQQLAGKMKQAIDDKLYEIQHGLSTQRDIWELYGATRLRTQELLDRSEALLREANATQDKTKAAELRNDSIHIRKKAVRKAKKAQTFAEEIQRQSELRVEELRQRSMGSSSLGSSSGAASF